MEVDIWLVWLAVALVLAVAEIFTTGFFLLPFAIGAAVAAALDFVWGAGSIAWQWASFVGLSSLLLVVLRRFADRVTHESPQKVAGNRLLGRTGVVLSSIEPHSMRGTVRVDREEWRADTVSETALAEGDRITVVAVEGTHLLVRPADEAASADA